MKKNGKSWMTRFAHPIYIYSNAESYQSTFPASSNRILVKELGNETIYIGGKVPETPVATLKPLYRVTLSQ